MLGRLGWRGQCSCCNGPRSKHQIKREERRNLEREFAAWADEAAEWVDLTSAAAAEVWPK